MKPILAAFTLAIVLSAVATAALGTEVAQAKCDPPRFNDYNTYRFVGSIRDASGITGVQSRLSHYSPWVTPHNPAAGQSTVSSWVMLNISTTFGYAQAGWIEFPHGYPAGQRFSFKQHINGIGAVQTQLFSASPEGSLAYYKVEYASSQFKYYRSGVLLWTDSTWFTPNRAQAAGETHSYDDQMPGAYYTRQHFLDTRVRIGSGSYQAFAGNAYNSDVSQYVLEGTSTYDMNIRDAACLY